MIYNILAPFYDAFLGDVDYRKWADFIEKVFAKYSEGKPVLGLDLGCGTGNMTLELSERGYDMTGVDYSSEMLDVASERARSMGYADKILWLCQNMTEFELYGTVDFAVCCLDGINHLCGKNDIDKCFSLVHNYLIPDGIFIFDVNGRRKFEEIYSDKTYAMEDDAAFCVWENYYNEKTKLCDFYITLFEKKENGAYERYDECQRERMYTLKSVKRHLAKNGLEFIGAYSDFDFSEGDDDSERIYIIARCKKEDVK